jgi:uncharacterized protein
MTTTTTLREQGNAQPRNGRRFDPTPGKVRYSPRWLGATAAGGLLAGLGIAVGGLPAAAVVGTAGAAGLAYATLHEPRSPRLEQVSLRFPNLPPALDGLRIGQISDMHLGMRYSFENSRWAVRQMAEQRPDLLVFTGDFVSYEHAIASLPDALIDLPHAPLGSFAVPGNHDYWEGVPEIQHILATLGIELMINTNRLVSVRGEGLLVAGVDDMWDGVPDLAATLAGAPQGAFRLLLAHCPDYADEVARHDIQVQLSGHTHGGHMRLPGLGSFCLPRCGWRYPVGHAQVGKTRLYVSRGLGGLPLRLGCPPEATIITLRRG